MEKKGTGLVVLVIILSLLVLGLSGYIVYDKVFSDKDGVNNNNNIVNDGKNFTADDYFDVTEYVFNNQKDSIKKVVFKNLDESLISNFNVNQEKHIENIKNSSDDYYLNFNDDFDTMIESNIWGQINNGILTIYEKYNLSWGMGTEYINIINIDLNNQKILENEDILKMANTNFLDLANKYYSEELSICNNLDNDDDKCFFKKSDNAECNQNDMVSKRDFIEQKDYYTNQIKNGLDNVIFTYIKDGKIYYTYYSHSIIYIYQNICKGGPFELVDVKLN